MSNLLRPGDYKEFDDYSQVEPAQPQEDGTYAPVLNKDDLRICSTRWLLMSAVTYSYATQLAPSCMYASYYALRKIYAGDEDAFNAAIQNQLECVFNATPPIAGLLLGAGLAIEDQTHLAGMRAENDLKVGLMGPVSGVGDVFVWILPTTILGSIAGYMAMAGNPVGVLLWLAIWLAITVWRLQNYVQGYDVGTSVITKLGEKISTLTDAASILGLTVIGSLIFSTVTVYVPVVFEFGEVSLSLQTGVLDLIFPNLLAAVIAFVCYRLIKRGVRLNWIIIAVVVLSLVCAAFGILGVPPAA